MSLDFARLRSISARQLAAALERDGFALARQRGSHRHYSHPDGRRVTVSFHHAGETFRPGTLRSMIELQAKWGKTELERLGLL